MAERILYHYTCDGGRRGIGDEGTLRPHSHGVVWLTDLELPFREALGLTSYMLGCDRTQHRYRVTDDSTCVPWVKFTRRDRSIEIEGIKPMHWWVSEDPVPVVYDPHRITSMEELPKNATNGATDERRDSVQRAYAGDHDSHVAQGPCAC